MGSPLANPALSNSLFSKTVVISATFTGAGAAFNGSTQIVAVPVPEPASLALFGMGFIRRREANQAG